MSFEYRELTTQISFNAGKEDADGVPCPCASSLTGVCPCMDQTEQPQCTMVTDKEKDKDKDKDKGRQALAFLRQQLREAVAAG